MSVLDWILVIEILTGRILSAFPVIAETLALCRGFIIFELHLINLRYL